MASDHDLIHRTGLRCRKISQYDAIIDQSESSVLSRVAEELYFALFYAK